MAHYIAELMIQAERANEEERAAAQKKCFEAILMLWKHREALPDGTRPFEVFESVLKTLDRLNPENDNHWLAHFRSPPDTCDSETKQILQIMENLDESARSMMSVLLNVAMGSCQDKETLTYLQNAKEELGDKRVQVVERIFDFRASYWEGKIDDAKRKLIQERLKHLDRFLESAKTVRKLLGRQLLD
jgi:hypothetical protein